MGAGMKRLTFVLSLVLLTPNIAFAATPSPAKSPSKSPSPAASLVGQNRGQDRFFERKKVGLVYVRLIGRLFYYF